MNPFRPGFASPPVLAGREDLLRDFERLLATSGLAVGSFHAIYGNRGVGKTSVLDWVRHRAADRGWAVISHEAQPGEAVLDAVLRQLQAIDGLPRKLTRQLLATRQAWGEQIQRLNLGVYQLEARRARPDLGDDLRLEFTDTVARVVTALSASHRGLCLLIDEAQQADPSELGPLGPALQRLERDRVGPCVVALAGLPTLPAFIVDAFSYGERLTYHELGNIEPSATAHAFAQPIGDAGHTINGDALARLVTASGGYPYLIQELGYHTLDAAADAPTVTLRHAETGIMIGRQRFEAGLYRARWSRLPTAERNFVTAMAAVDTDRPVRTAEIAERLGKTTGAVSVVRASLIDRGLLIAPVSGQLQCTIPGFLAYALAQTDTPRRPPKTGAKPSKQTGRPAGP
jgi:AAA ATPase domain